MKRIAILSIFAGALAASALLLLVVAPTGRVQAQPDSHCQTIEAPADAGYGVSELRKVEVCR